MADIAVLVAEEYERRLKILRNSRTAAVAAQESDFFSGVSVLGREIDKSFSSIYERVEAAVQLKSGLEPNSQIGAAVINGFFSA